MIKKLSSVLLTPIFLAFGMGGFAVPIFASPSDSPTFDSSTNDFVVEVTRSVQFHDEDVGMDSDTKQMHTVTFLNKDGNVDFILDVEHGATIGYIPSSDWEEGIFDYWSNAITSEKLRETTPILEDATYLPNYIFIEWLIINALDDAGLSLDDVSVESFADVVEYIKSAQES